MNLEIFLWFILVLASTAALIGLISCIRRENKSALSVGDNQSLLKIYLELQDFHDKFDKSGSYPDETDLDKLSQVIFSFYPGMLEQHESRVKEFIQSYQYDLIAFDLYLNSKRLCCFAMYSEEVTFETIIAYKERLGSLLYGLRSCLLQEN